MEVIKHIELVAVVVGCVLAIMQFVTILIIKSFHREIDTSEKRTDGVERRLNECWNELNDCKENCDHKRESIRNEIKSECRMRHEK